VLRLGVVGKSSDVTIRKGEKSCRFVAPRTMKKESSGPITMLGVAIALGVLIAEGPLLHAQSEGDPSRGQDIFAAKQCGRCHRPPPEASVGPPLPVLRRPQGAYELAGRLWNHAPAMFTVLRVEGLEWPRIDATEMANLMAYLQADPARDPPADPLKGQMILVAKGCLKCHTWKGEGARVGPELAELRGSFAPASMWAATMWAHTPRMAKVALERGIVYPRFTADEMVHLLAFLRGEGTAR
jgi:cytochrome c2